VNTTVEKTQRRGTAWLGHGLDLAVRIVPVATLVAIGALFSAEQAVKPQHRAIKAALFLGLMAFMLRFEMVYAVYLFAVLFIFPSGISIASSNSVLMTVIPMIWAVRAASTKTRLFRRTALDAPVAVFLLAYVLSFMNVDTNHLLIMGLKVFWRQLACFAFFYMIVTFVDTPEKLTRLLKLMAITITLVMLTAIVELVAPGTVIVPGWIDLSRGLEEGGRLAVRVHKMRVGGVLASDANLADFGSFVFCLLAYFAWKARNPADKVFWALATAATLVGVLSTGNRGGLIGLAIAIAYTSFLFRRKVPFRQLSATLLTFVVLVVVVATLLDRYTVATSPLDRLLHTQMVGMVPETRTMTWAPSLAKSMEHPFFGHGPYFDVVQGLAFQFWPHNAYLFYLQTLGLFGLGAFVWIMARIYRMTLAERVWRYESHPVGDLMALARVWFVVFAVLQLRSDHQRDDIYPYMVWLWFGVVVVAERLLREEAEAAVQPVPAGAGVPAR
jgi:hypothetical protein